MAKRRSAAAAAAAAAAEGCGDAEHVELSRGSQEMSQPELPSASKKKKVKQESAAPETHASGTKSARNDAASGVGVNSSSSINSSSNINSNSNKSKSKIASKGKSDGGDDHDDASDDESDDIDNSDSDGGEVSAAAAADAAAAHSGGGSVHDKRFAVPTADEMRHLRETEQLFSNNVLRLQLDALLDDSSITNKGTGALQQWMRELRAHVTRALPSEQQPVHCGVAGSFVPQTCLRGRLNADIVVVMPTPVVAVDNKKKSESGAGSSSAGVHMSGALFPLIAQYTLLLADVTKSFCNAEAIASRGHKHICCVSCTPFGSNLSGMERSFTVRMHVIADATSLPHRRFSPSHNNFRPSVAVTPYPPTPHYNSSLMEDMTMEALHAVVVASLSSCPAATQAAIFLKIFMLQRSSLSLPYSFHPMAPSLIIADALASGSASRALSSYQILRVALERIAAWTSAAPWRLLSPVAAPPPFDSPPGEAFGDDKWMAAFPVCIIDPTGRVNLARRICAGSWSDLRSHASQLLLQLSSSSESIFESTFIRRCSHADRFDDIVRVTLRNFVPDEPGSPADVVAGLMLGSKLQDMLPKRLACCVPVSARGVFSDGGVGSAWDGVVTLGLQLNDQGAWSLLERGPHSYYSHDSAAVAAFKAMWGDLVETRQFRDGSVMECIPWSEKPSDKWRATSVAVETALQRVCSAVVDVNAVATDFEESALGLSSSKSREKAMKERDSLRVAIQDLSSILADIPTESLPLRITAVHNVDPVLRSTIIPIPSPSPFCGADKMFGHAVSRVVSPIHIIGSLEGSNQWPTDINALRALKTAIMCTLASAIRDKVHEVQPHRTHLDICHKGYAFRLVLHVEIERDIAAAAPSSTSSLTRGIDVVYTIAPMHAAAITSATLRLPSLAGCIKLAQRWLIAHSMGGCIPHAALELLCVSVCSSGCRRPLTPWAAFLRWLDFMAHTDFSAHVQPVDPALTWPSTSVTSSTSSTSSSSVNISSPAAASAAAASIKQLEVCALVLPTPYDASGTAFTSDHPTRAELKRLQMLAESVSSAFAAEGSGHMQISNADAFDIVLDFHPNWQLLPPLRATPFPNDVPPPLLDFSPANAVELSLRSCVGSAGGIVTKGVSPSGGERLCVALNPLQSLPSKFRVAHASYTCTLPDGTCVPDFIGILRAASASGSEVVSGAYVNVGVRCAL